jgi:hypothetical protein
MFAWCNAFSCSIFASSAFFKLREATPCPAAASEFPVASTVVPQRNRSKLCTQRFVRELHVGLFAPQSADCRLLQKLQPVAAERRD